MILLSQLRLTSVKTISPPAIIILVSKFLTLNPCDSVKLSPLTVMDTVSFSILKSLTPASIPASLISLKSINILLLSPLLFISEKLALSRSMRLIEKRIGRLLFRVSFPRLNRSRYHERFITPAESVIRETDGFVRLTLPSLNTLFLKSSLLIPASSLWA